jgi:hypothetical protein
VLVNRPLYIFDLDGTLALIDHRRHLVDKHSCTACYGTGHKRREPPEVAKMVLDSRGRPTALPATDPCTECDGTGRAKQNWRAFFAACVDDDPNLPVIRTLKALRRGGAECWIWSGRSDEMQAETEEWLYKHGCLKSTMLLHWQPFAPPEAFRMRKAGDFTPDEQLKFGWLADMEPPERRRLTGVFDDRDKVVAMWRAHGVPCFQVAPGAF